MDSTGFRACDEFVFVVFLGSPDHAVLRHVSHHLLDFAGRHGNVDDQTFAVGQLLLGAARHSHSQQRQHKQREQPA